MNGKKTYLGCIGILAVAAVKLLNAFGVIKIDLPAEWFTGAITLFGGMAGIGFAHKIEKAKTIAGEVTKAISEVEKLQAEKPAARSLNCRKDFTDAQGGK